MKFDQPSAPESTPNPLPPSGGGTGTSTVFTQGSVVFAGALGVYSQDNPNFTYTDSTNLLTLGNPGIAATPTDSLLITNTTAAANGVQQQSPNLHFSARGWDTGTSTSKSIDFRMYVLPVQSNPANGMLTLGVSVAGAAYTDFIQINAISVPTITIGNGGSTPNYRFGSSSFQTGLVITCSTGSASQPSYNLGTNRNSGIFGGDTNGASFVSTTTNKIERARTFDDGHIVNLTAPVATANYGTVNIGSGAFDGSTTGFFVGSTSGTSLAVNEVSGYAGNLLDLQIAGTSNFKIDSAGNVTDRGSLSASGFSAFNNNNVTFTMGNGTNGSALTFAQSGNNVITSGTGNQIRTTGTFIPSGAGSANHNILNITYTLNGTAGVQTGIATGILLNATETTLNGLTHNLEDLQVGSVSKWSISNAGVPSTNGTPGITTTVTSASLVGKTITITNGLITGFA